MWSNRDSIDRKSLRLGTVFMLLYRAERQAGLQIATNVVTELLLTTEQLKTTSVNALRNHAHSFSSQAG
jgi:hypothetical protein